MDSSEYSEIFIPTMTQIVEARQREIEAHPLPCSVTVNAILMLLMTFAIIKILFRR